MDSDCLIKITKAGLKEMVVDHVAVLIPQEVKIEVVDVGLVKKFPDALMVAANIEKKKLGVLKGKKRHRNGDAALIEEFKQSGCDFVATDDSKLIRFLRAEAIPFLVPGVLVYDFYMRGVLKSVTQARMALEKLKPWISSEEYNMVSVLLEKRHEH